MLTRPFFALAVLSSLPACSNSSAQPPPPAAEEAAPEADAKEEPAESKPAPAVVAKAGDGGCSDADLSLSASMEVGKVDGVAIKVSDFGREAVDAEKEARREYCNAVDRIRAGALQRAIDDKLLAGAAKKAGKDVEAYVQGRLEALTETPSDDEVEAFYDEHKKPDAPPFELVADQVKSSMMEDRTRAAFGKLIGELAKGAEIERSLPDVRPEALPVDIPSHTATFGPADAKIEIVEFSDFECPYCARAAAGVSEIKAKYGDKVRFAYRNFPLSFHPHAELAAKYAQCAGRQEKFWEMHDGIFALTSIDADGLRKTATEVGLDGAKLDECLQGSDVQTEITADMRKATEVGVSGTPTFFINGRLFNGSPTGEGLGRAIEEELARAQG